MLWFAVWTTLVLATLVGAALLGLSLWRKAKALMAQMRESTEALEQLQGRVAELEALRTDDEPFTPAVVAAPAERAQWRDVRRTNRATRRARAAERHARTHGQWEALLDPERVERG